jgi:hypothetical protein
MGIELVYWKAIHHGFACSTSKRHAFNWVDSRERKEEDG